MNKVSVIIPAYNKADWTLQTVASVLNQTYSNLEVIVVDDGSTDDTQRKMASLQDPRVRYIRKSNGGASSARNLGIREASGAFITFVDCDDLFLPDKIEISVKYLEQNPQFGFIHTAAYFINETGKIISTYNHKQSQREGLIADRLILGNFVCNSTVLVRKECLKKAGFFDESIFTPADWDMWLKLAQFGEAGYIGLPLTMYRVVSNYVFKNIEQARKEEETVIQNFFVRNSEKMLLKARALSNMHLRFAQCQLLKNNLKLMVEEVRHALFFNIFNLKAWAFSLWLVVHRRSLERFLVRRILKQ